MHEEHGFELDDVVEHEEPSKKRIKKFYIFIVVILLIGLLVINTLPGFHIVSLISGRIVSSTLTNDSFLLNSGGKVIFEKDAFEKLQTIYLKNQKNEFAACLTGEKKEGNYIVDNIYIPKTFSHSFRSVSSEFCNSDTIISMHTHPYLRCIFSNQDILSYSEFKKRNPNAITALMCDKDRMTFYGY